MAAVTIVIKTTMWMREWVGAIGVERGPFWCRGTLTPASPRVLVDAEALRDGDESRVARTRPMPARHPARSALPLHLGKADAQTVQRHRRARGGGHRVSHKRFDARKIVGAGAQAEVSARHHHERTGAEASNDSSVCDIHE
jgi:hypothetical protein